MITSTTNTETAIFGTADCPFVAASQLGDDLAAAKRAVVTTTRRLSEDLSVAAESGHPELIRFLITAGADVHADDDHPLWVAAYRGRAEVVRILLTAGADASARDSGAMRWARKNGHYDVVKLLLDWES